MGVADQRAGLHPPGVDGQISPRNAADRKRIFDDRVDITTRAFILATITTRRPNSGGDMPKRDQYASASAAAVTRGCATTSVTGTSVSRTVRITTRMPRANPPDPTS